MIMLNKSNLNFIKTIISPINIQGIIIKIAVNTFDCIILYGFSGKLFKILNDFPSIEIIELVIDVIKLVKHINPKNIAGIHALIYSNEKPGAIFINISSRLSNFIVIKILPTINSTNPKPAFVTNTGEFINLLNSFFISAFIGVKVFIL